MSAGGLGDRLILGAITGGAAAASLLVPAIPGWRMDGALSPALNMALAGLAAGALLAPLWRGGAGARVVAAVLTPYLVLFLALPGQAVGRLLSEGPAALVWILGAPLWTPVGLAFAAILNPWFGLCYAAGLVAAWCYGERRAQSLK